MKRLLVAITASVLITGLTAGCGGATTYTDPEETIQVGIGEEFVIALDSNPTTGYGWEADFGQDKLELIDNTYESDEKDAYVSARAGVGGTEYFRFKTLKAGSTDITFVYKRSWEPEIIEQKVFEVEIK
jgi:inhibitor of cysteine peptidase